MITKFSMKGLVRGKVSKAFQNA